MSRIIPIVLIALVGVGAYYFVFSNQNAANHRINKLCMDYTSYLPGDAKEGCACIAEAIGPEVARGYDMGKINKMSNTEFLSVMGFSLSEQSVRDDISDCAADAMGLDPNTVDKALRALSKIW